MMTTTHTHSEQPVLSRGADFSEATSAMILVHGRGATADGILGLAGDLAVDGMAYLAPQAARRTWYPMSFLAPMEANEPGLSTGLELIGTIVDEVVGRGVPAERIVLGGFSQGACLASEFVARRGERFGGLLVFSGGLIGPPGTPRDYDGDLGGTPMFIGSSDPDSHVPVERVRETADVFTRMGARVDLQIYPGMGHTITLDEIDRAKAVLANLGQ